MSPLVAYHATRAACRMSILENGLLPNQPAKGRPFGVYVFRWDSSFDHVGWNSSHTEWCPYRGLDLWEVAYIGPVTPDRYVLNGMVLLERVDHAALLVTR